MRPPNDCGCNYTPRAPPHRTKVDAVNVTYWRDLAGEIEAFAREPDGGLMVLPDVSTADNRDLIIALAARHRLPAVYPFRLSMAPRERPDAPLVTTRRRHFVSAWLY